MKTNNYTDKALFKASIYMLMAVMAFYASDTLAQARPDPFAGATNATDDLLSFFRGGFARALGGLAITGALVGALFNRIQWQTFGKILACVIGIFLVPEIIGFFAV